MSFDIIVKHYMKVKDLYSKLCRDSKKGDDHLFHCRIWHMKSACIWTGITLHIGMVCINVFSVIALQFRSQIMYSDDPWWDVYIKVKYLCYE